MEKRIEQKIRDMICERFGSVKEFSLAINIPYTTVDSILKRGVEKANVVNIIKICAKLGIDTDALASGEIKAKMVLGQENLSLPEQEHIKKYRTLDERGKIVVDAVLDAEYEYSKIIQLPIVARSGNVDPPTMSLKKYLENGTDELINNLPDSTEFDP